MKKMSLISSRWSGDAAENSPAATPRSPWAVGAVALAALLGCGLFAPDAQALALGRLSVQSALGEPLRAEIDVPDINADEASSLKVNVASAEAFRAAGMDFNAALVGVQLSLQRRADGRAFLRLNSDKAVLDPFVDVIIEATWSSGRVVRDYTLLLDPPSLRKPAPVAEVQPVAAPVAPAAVAAAPPVVTPDRSVPAANGARTSPVAPPVAPTVAPAKAPVAAAAAQARATGSVIVKPGETATLIANRIKTDGLALDQVLIGMLRANPSAFIGNDINYTVTETVFQ